MAPAAAAQERPALTVDLIMQRPEAWVGGWPSDVHWTEAGDRVYFDWNPQGRLPADSLFAVGAGDGTPTRAAEPEAPRHAGRWAETGQYSPDGRRRAATRDGDVVVTDTRTGETTRLTRTREAEADARFLADGRLVFRRASAGGPPNLFALDLATGALTQLTDLRSGSAPAPATPAPADAYLSAQQRRLFDVLRERAVRDSLREAARSDDPDAPPTVYVGSDDVRGLAVDPTGRFATFNRTRDDGATPTRLVRFVTASGYAEEITARPKVGAPNAGAELYVTDLARDTTVRVDLTQLPGATDPSDVRREAGATADSTRQLFAWGPLWSPEGRYAVVDVRTRDNKDRWIARLDPATGALTVLDRQRDEAWLAGPGISWWGGESAWGWLPDGRRLWIQSEKTGWSHLYAVDAESGTVEPLTEGAFEVGDATLAPDGRTWLFGSSEGDLGQWHVWRMPVARPGAAAQAWASREKLTEGVGRWEAALAPDGEHVAYLYSTSNRPPEVYVGRLGRTPTRVTESPTQAWLAYPWREAEIVEIPASDGARVPARIYRPERPNGAAVLFVHGAGYLQNAHRWWSSYVREYQFHNLLADRGYVVLDLDYRASAGLGRDWRAAVHRHMGGRDLQDYVDASRWVGEAFGIEPERVGIYGGSYGGFLTLMALFTEAEHFGAGAALRSVTDWAHYNDTYTRNILGTPVEDPEAYRRSSPIEFAAGLEDPLLMAHGLIDDNVQPQDIFRLSQRLIELRKTGWELALYPVEPHGFTEPSSWADEYRRILELFERTVSAE